MEPEVITRAEQPPGDEPSLTLSQLSRLLREATAYERAANPAPIVIHTAPQPATAPRTAPAGASVYVPMPPAAAPVQALRQSSERNPWPLIFVSSMCGVVTAGYAAAASGSDYAVIAVLACASAWCLSVYQIVFNHKEA